MERIWEGQLRGSGERVEVYMATDDDNRAVSVAREMRNVTTDWYGADSVESRPSNSTHDIWVARFHDHSELLIEFWHMPETLKVAYRSISFHSWGAPAFLDEINADTRKADWS
jgi:hypothetical protein